MMAGPAGLIMSGFRLVDWQGLRKAGDPIFGYELKQAVRCGKVILKKRVVGFGPERGQV